MRLRCTAMATALALCASAGRADEQVQAPAIYRVEPRADAAILGASALTIGVPALFASKLIHPSCPCDRGSVNAFDRPAIGNHDDVADAVSTVTVALAAVGPAALDWRLLGAGEALKTDLVVFAEVLLVNGAVVQVFKYSVQRPLPRTYAGDPSLVDSPRGYRSFYSGHTSMAVAALSAAAFTARHRYGERWWPWVVVAVTGAAVGLERVAAGRHFPTDVMVGAVAGAVVGIGIPWLHLRDPNLAVVPIRGGLALAGRF